MTEAGYGARMRGPPCRFDHPGSMSFYPRYPRHPRLNFCGVTWNFGAVSTLTSVVKLWPLKASRRDVDTLNSRQWGAPHLQLQRRAALATDSVVLRENPLRSAAFVNHL